MSLQTRLICFFTGTETILTTEGIDTETMTLIIIATIDTGMIDTETTGYKNNSKVLKLQLHKISP